jgi:membrane protease YdiL (CAAX protease family)
LPDEAPQPIAHWLHTVALFGLFILTTTLTERRAATRELGNTAHIPTYLASIAMEWVLLGLVIAGIHQRRAFLVRAFRNRARTFAESLGIGAAVYMAGFVAIAVVSSVLYFTPLFHKRNEAAITAIAPHTPLEFLLWFVVSLSAGVCEELVFRGYLLQQLTAWTRRPVASILLGALLFGSVHLYEGLGAILPLAALALVYGAVVQHFKGDLRAVVIAHTLQNFIVALLLLARPYVEHYQPHP